MAENFSGLVRITNVSDYIEPSQACILPLQNLESERESTSKVAVRRRGLIPDELNVSKKKVTVSLNDCLACNGCVTSAESVLVQEQSMAKFLEGLSSSSRSIVTVSPQSLCSIAVKHGLSVARTAELLVSKLKSLGADYVVDSSYARYLSLSYSYKEFIENRDKGPVITSVCPGFACYAEKVHGKLLLPYLSRVRSPQAIMGSLIKNYLAKRERISPEKIFHATVMPCYDKKLEASRSDFISSFREVDCVITTGEADSLFNEEEEPSCSRLDPVNSSSDWLTSLQNGVVIGGPGGASGGYAEYVVQRFLKDNNLTPENLRVSNGQKDLEVIEVVKDELILLRVAKCYGFRNIQILVQKLKRGKCPYNYIEVMACPSGCANGGGQIRVNTTDARSSILESVIKTYNTLRPVPQLEESIEDLKKQWEELSDDWEKWLFTEFHIVDRNIMTLQDIRW